jgi:hypothetical protein
MLCLDGKYILIVDIFENNEEIVYFGLATTNGTFLYYQ